MGRRDSDSDGMTPLIHAAMRKHVPTVEKLLELGADIEKPGTQGYPPLALSIAEAKFEVAKALMEAGADIDKPVGPEQLTPLMVAASQVSPGEGSIFLPGSTRPIDIARALIKAGANVNAQSKDGVTALMIAAARNVAPRKSRPDRSSPFSRARVRSGAGPSSIACTSVRLNVAWVIASDIMSTPSITDCAATGAANASATSASSAARRSNILASITSLALGLGPMTDKRDLLILGGGLVEAMTDLFVKEVRGAAEKRYVFHFSIIPAFEEYGTFSIVRWPGGVETLRFLFCIIPAFVEYVSFPIVRAPGGSETLRVG